VEGGEQGGILGIALLTRGDDALVDASVAASRGRQDHVISGKRGERRLPELTPTIAELKKALLHPRYHAESARKVTGDTTV
jgi:hypothetical protein